MKSLKAIMAISGFCLIFIYPNQMVAKASLSSSAFNHFTFPMPVEKPTKQMIMKQEDNETYINEKQAAVAALGLYLGYQKAIVPHATAR